MKKNNLRYILGSISLALVLLAIVSEHFSTGPFRESINIDRFQQTVLKKEQLADKYLQSLGSQTIFNSTFFQSTDYNRKLKFLENNGIVLLVYQNDSLILWTDNSISPPNRYDPSLFESKFLNLNHGWFFVKKVQPDTIRILTLIRIKNTYPYQNSFLKNEFQKDFNISSNVKLTVNPELGYPIFNKTGDYLFSLMPQPGNLTTISYLTYASILYILCLISGLLFALVWIRDISTTKHRRWAIILMGISLVGVREIMLGFEIPNAFYSLEFFSPLLYAASYHNASLGDFILNALFILTLSYAFIKYFDLPGIVKNKPGWVFYTIFGLMLLIIFVFYYFLLTQFKSLVIDSNIFFQMHEFSGITFYSFFGYLGLILLFFTLLIYCDALISLCIKHCSLWRYYILTIASAGGLSMVAAIFLPGFKIWLWMLPVAILLVHGLIIYRSDSGFRYSLFTLVLIGVSAFLVHYINDLSHQKERQNRIITATNLATEYDPVSEALLMEMDTSLINDKKIQTWCEDPFVNEPEIMDYIQNKFFKGYWEQFQVQITLCNEMDNLRVEPDEQIRNCFEFFTEMIAETGDVIPGTNFYLLNTFNGMISYLGVLEFNSTQFKKVKIYLRIDSRISDEGLGYPDLLLDEKLNRSPINENYSYAKYKDGILIASSGKFNYPPENEQYGNQVQEYSWTESNGYNHLAYRFGSNSVVVSTPILNWYNRFITFPYVFVLFCLFALFVQAMEKYPWPFIWEFNFKHRIQYSLIGIMMLFFLLLGGGSVFYSIKQFKAKHNQQLSEKLQLVKQDLLEGVYSSDQLDQLQNPFLIERLRRFSNFIYADINIYDLQGNLLSSSRPEIFERNLLGNKMNYLAYNQLYHQKEAQFIHKENIGEMKYLSAYEKIVDENNNPLAYLNLPYFTRSRELQQEMFNLVIAGVNLHLFMILLAIFLSIFISNKITYPLQLIQDRFQQTRFGTTSEQINYTKNDEIGKLVKEYNRMLVELEESAERLARSERESAWREMARQIAHEIKNPLTPMKLNVQFLQKSWDDKVPNWGEHLKRISKTLIEQIDNLSAISSAFSDFAKMPQPNNERVNLVHVLRQVIQLFQNDILELKLNLNNITDAWVFIDKKQAARMYVNLINNAIQSIPEGRKGLIGIELQKKKKRIVTMVSDNGTGITDEVKEKLFVPNFTTKSGGMGLGLAIVKNIVENAGGTINVESKINEGSSFSISFPKMPEEFS